MTALTIDIAKWIEDGKLNLTTGDLEPHGCTIGQCIPPIFETFCKIFHPFESTPDEPDILESRNEQAHNETLTLNDIMQRRKEWLQEYSSKKWENINWQTLAEKYKLIFHNQINTRTFVTKFKKIGWQKNLIFPNEGHLPRQQLIKLLSILKLQATSNEVLIYQCSPHTSWKDNKPEDLVSCSFEEVLEYFSSDFIGYLFATDKSWVVFTDTDLTFTIVGGQRKLVDAIIASDLEAIECTAETRVDNFSDKIN